MAFAEGAQLAQAVREKSAEFRKLCAGLDETTASKAPQGRWSPKEIVSHLCGSEEGDFSSVIRLVLDKETPEIHLEPGNSHFTEKRVRMSMTELLAEFERRTDVIADMVSGLTPEQLGRKAHIPGLKESPLGEYPTLGAFTRGIAESHIQYHIDHMKEILEALGAQGKR